MVHDAKAVAGNIRDQPTIGQWRASNAQLLDSVGKVRVAVAGPDQQPPALPEPPISAMSNLNFGQFFLFIWFI